MSHSCQELEEVEDPGADTNGRADAVQQQIYLSNTKRLG